MPRLAAVTLVITILCVAVLPVASQEYQPDVVYGHKDGLAMTFDVFRPTGNVNRAGVLFMVSGGWYSNWAPRENMQHFCEPLTAAGFTVFTVRHGSSPRYSIPEAVSDVRRAVRYIRLHAQELGVDPQRLGVYGMSAGGHLSLMLGTTADDGDEQADDALLRVSDRVQAVVAYVAPTDLTIMVREAPDRLPAYASFPALDLDLASAREYSPLLQATADDAPTLLLAGVQDELVPIDHSRRILAALQEHKVEVKIVEYENSGHGFSGDDRAAAMKEMVDWFQQHLLPADEKPPATQP